MPSAAWSIFAAFAHWILFLFWNGCCLFKVVNTTKAVATAFFKIKTYSVPNVYCALYTYCCCSDPQLISDDPLTLRLKSEIAQLKRTIAHNLEKIDAYVLLIVVIILRAVFSWRLISMATRWRTHRYLISKQQKRSVKLERWKAERTFQRYRRNVASSRSFLKINKRRTCSL